MAKFRGLVGYFMDEREVAPGIWEPVIEERMYSGDFIRNTSRVQTGEHLNDGLRLSDNISIVLDPFAYSNFSNIRYVEYMHTKWKVESIEVKYPRLILTVGGIYNEEQT